MISDNRIRTKSLLVLFTLFWGGNVLCAEETNGWTMIKGKHFIVKYAQSREFAEKTSAKAEVYYTAITDKLGITRYGDFWLWDNRVNITIYRDKESFQKAESAPGWASGKANYSTKSIATFEGDDAFFDSVLPHEIGHLIFRDFTAENKSVPDWIKEGIAQLQEEGKRNMALQALKGYNKEKKLYSLEDLGKIVIAKETDPEKARIFYVESLEIIGFMIDKYGAESFGRFCDQLKKGKNVAEALRFTYSDSIRTIQLLEASWKKYVEEQQ